jgi:hypothetical protein
VSESQIGAISPEFEVDGILRYEPNSGLANRVEKTNPTGWDAVLSGRLPAGFEVGVEFYDTNPISVGAEI